MSRRVTVERQGLWLAALSISLLVASPASAQQEAPNACDHQDPVIAADRLKEPWWAARHADILARIAGHADPDVILIGDSITHNYDKSKVPDENFRPTWDRFYAPRRSLNLGFGGDTSAQVLWRLQHGELDDISPAVAILLIGTNDTAQGHDAGQTQCGIDTVIKEIARRLPKTRILLLGILPSAISQAKSATDSEINAELSTRYAEDPRVIYLDIGPIFLRSDGSLDTSVFYDPRLPGRNAKALHPDTIGQERMAEAIEPTLAGMLQAPPQVPLDAMANANTAIIPVPRLEHDSYDWYERHHAELGLARSIRPKIVMIGDSITHFWAGPPVSTRRNGPNAWRRLFRRTSVLNLGFGWDRTQNVLWRLRQGELRGLSPRTVIINIGTNNLTGTANARANTPAEVVEGIAAIVREVRRQTPASRIIVMAIFPRGHLQTDPYRQPIAETNRLLARRFGHDQTLCFLDIGTRFLNPNGALRSGIMPDGTHPSEAGYKIWASALARVGIRR